MIRPLRATAPRISAWWQARSERERLLLGALATTAGAWLAITAILQPLLGAHAAAEASIARADAALARLAALPAIDTAATSGDAQPATAVITATAPDYGMTIRRLEPDGDGARVTLADAGYPEILRWVQALESEHDLHVASIQVDRRPDPGVVSATMTLQR